MIRTQPTFLILLLLFVAVVSSCKKGEKKTDSASSIEEKNQVAIGVQAGNIVIRLMPEVAPKSVANFKKLAEAGFYDLTTFHRVIPGFVIQGGDPLSKDKDRSNDGTGGPGYTIPAEFSEESHTRGAVSMARGPDPNSAGSQFFIVVQNAPKLDRQYTIFGRVISGMDVVDKIVSVPRDMNDNPLQPVQMLLHLKKGN